MYAVFQLTVRREQGDGSTRSTSTTSTADTMDVVFRIVRVVIVEHVSNVSHILKHKVSSAAFRVIVSVEQ